MMIKTNNSDQFSPMNFRAIRKTIVICCVLVCCYLVIQKLFFVSHISPPSGDGTFTDLSHRDGIVSMPGYRISMNEFNLSDEQNIDYQIVNMPSIGRDCYLFFAIRNPEKDPSVGLNPGLTASVSIDIISKSGGNILNMSGVLSEFTIMTSIDDFMSLYRFGKSKFTPEARGDYIVRLKYKPDPQLRGYRGFVYLRSGARK